VTRCLLRDTRMQASTGGITLFRRRILLLYAGISAAILVVTAVTLQASGVLGGFVEDFARNYVNPDLIRLAGADFDLSGGRVRLRGIEVGDKDDEGGPVMQVDNVELDVDPIGFDLRKIHLQGLQLHLRWTEDGLVLPSLDSLLSEAARTAPRSENEDQAPLRFLRRLSITDSTLRLSFPGLEPIALDALRIETSPTSNEGGAPGEIVLEGDARLAGEYVVRVSGTGTVDGDSFRVFLDLEDAPLDLVTEVAPRLRELVDGIGEVSGNIARTSLWARYQRGDEEPWRFGGQVEIDSVRGTVPEVPYALVDATVRASFQSQRGGIASLQLQDASVDGNLAVTAIARNVVEASADAPRTVEAEVRAEDVLIDDRIARLLERVPVADKIWSGLSPEGGRGTGRFAIVQELSTDENGEQPRPDVEFDLDVTGTSIQLEGFPTSDGRTVVRFPLRITEAGGSVRLRKGLVSLEGIEGRLSGGQITLDGAIDIVDGRPEGFRIDIDGTDVEFRDELREALEELVSGAAGHWDTYSPEGRAHVHIAIRPEDRPDRSAPVRVDVRLVPVAASAAWSGFPVRVGEIRGAIDIGDEGVTFDLEGRRNGAPVHLHGRFPNERGRTADAGDGLAMELWLQAERLEFDETVRQALQRLGADEATAEEPSMLDGVWRMLQPRGASGCELSLWKDPEREFADFDLRLDLLDAEIELETLPLPISALEGPVFIHRTGGDTRIDIGSVRGRIRNRTIAAATVLSQGTVLAPAAGPTRIEVVSLVRGLELTDELADALDTPAGPDQERLFPRENWNLLAPSGVVDVLLEQKLEDVAATPETTMTIQLRGVRSDLERLPFPLTATYGEVSVVGGQARFRDVRGQMRNVEVVCRRGEVYADGGTTVIHAEVSAENFPVDSNMANLMVGPIRTAYLDRSIRGTVQIRDLDVTMRVPENPDDMRVDLEGTFQTERLAMIVGVDITDVNGLVRIDEASIDATGGSVRGVVRDGSFTILQHPVRGCSADFLADSTKLRLRNVDSQLHGGKVTGYGDDDTLVYEFAGEGTTRANLAWRTVYLRDVLEAVGFEDVAYQGQLEGRLVLEELVGSNIVNARGNGELRITEGDLGEVPLFSEIYKILKPRQRPRFTDVRFGADFRDRKIDVEDLRIVSGLFTARGGGTIDMGGNLDMELAFPDLLKGPGWLLLPEVVSQLAGQVVSFEILGNLRFPTARPKFRWSGDLPEQTFKPIPARLVPRTTEDF
jgi:hypothetical protein